MAPSTQEEISAELRTLATVVRDPQADASVRLNDTGMLLAWAEPAEAFGLLDTYYENNPIAAPPRTVPMTLFFGVAADLTITIGYRKSSKQSATGMAAYEYARTGAEVTEAGNSLAARALSWAVALKPRSDFERKLSLVAQYAVLTGRVQQKDVGFAGYVVEAFRRHEERAATAKPARAEA